MSHLLSRACAAIFLTFILTGSAISATFTFGGEVTISPGPAGGPGDPDFPALGTAGTVELQIDDSVPGLALLDGGFMVPQVFEASVDVPGYISGSMVNSPDPSDFFSVTLEYLIFGAYGPTSIVDPGTEFYLPNARHSFRVNFGAPLLSVPTTVGELVAALSIPGANGYFSHELEGSPGFQFTRVAFPATSTPEVPLPAAGWLLLIGVAAFGVMRRRSA